MESAVEVVRLALGSLSHDTWYARVHAEGSNERNRAAYAAIRAAAEHYNEAPVADEDLRQFALHLKFFPHDLDIEFCFEPLFRHPHCPEGFRQLAIEQVFFKFRSYRISPAARRAIEQSLQAAEQRAERPCKLVKLNAEITYAFVVPFWSEVAPSMLTATEVKTGSEVPALGSDGQQTEGRGA